MRNKITGNNKAIRAESRFIRFILLIVFGVLLGSVLHMNLSCLSLLEDIDDEKTINIDTKLINKGAQKMEDAFIKADTLALSIILSETSLEKYRPFFEEMQPHMTQFGEVIKTRKLLYANEIFAVYEYKNGNEVYTFEMMVNDDGQWIITRL